MSTNPLPPPRPSWSTSFANTAWRLNRIPLLEADLLSRAMHPANEQAAIEFDIVDAHRLLANLGLHGHRLSRQFQKTLDQLREIQAERREREKHDLKDAASLLELYNHKGIPWQPADHGFVFSRDQVERFAERLKRLAESRAIAHFRLYYPPLPQAPASQRPRL